MSDKKNIKPLLEDISKENPFIVPENYFDNFTIRLTDKISSIEERKHPVRSFSAMRPQFVYLTVTFLVLVCLFGLGIYNHSFTKKLSVSELRHNIEFSIVNETDENELIYQLEVAENISVAQVDSLNINKPETSKHLIEYLSKEDIDINTIEDAM